MKEQEQKYTTVITAKKRFTFNLKEVFKYKDLILLFVRRNFKTKYAQTILGPLWFIIQPLLTTFIYTMVFNKIANLSTNGVPPFLFYLAGNLPWLYFSACILRTSNTFGENARMFGKVYFPRLVTPISTVITCLFNFLIQFGMFLVIWLVFLIIGDVSISWVSALTPVFLFLLGILGMSFGLIISSVTVRFRDLLVLVDFGVSLLVYATPVVFAAESLSDTAYTLIMCNPVSPIIEFIKYGWLGVGTLPWMYLGISIGVTAILFLLGLMLFNKTERYFIDIV